MSNYLFEYLIEKEIVSLEQIIEAFVHQSQNIPSQLSVLRESDLLSDQQLLTVLIHQISDKKPPFEIVKQLELLRDDAYMQLEELFHSKVQSLGSILVEKGALDQKSYFKALHDFTMQKEGVILHSAQILSVSEDSRQEIEGIDDDSKDVSSPENTEDDSNEGSFVNQAALDSLKELVNTGNVDECILKELDINPATSEELEGDEEDVEINQAALDSLKELVGSGGVDASVLENLEDQGNQEKEVSVEEVGISSAALDSLKELVGSGGVDASVLEELDTQAKSDSSLVSESANTDEETGISQAALDSLKELVGSGGIDSSVLDELTTSSSEGKDVKDLLCGYDGHLLDEEVFIDNLLRVYNVKTHEKICKLNELIGKSIKEGDYPLNLITKFLAELRVVKGGFYSVEASPIGKLLDIIEHRITELNTKFENETDINFDWIEKFNGVAPFCRTILTMIEEDQNLKSFIEDESLKDAYQSIYCRFKSEE